jgi:tetratricopeptide (TPR) repeat protein
LAWPASLAAQEAADQAPPKLQENLGSYHRSITSKVPEAQAYFDQGLRLLYAFNHEEAQAAFEEAARRDPSCAICFWGAALTLGPNINLPAMPERAEAAFALVQKAQAVSRHAGQVEKALIAALAQRYAHPAPTEADAQRALDTAYAEAMHAVVARFPTDPDVATLYAEAMMDLRPWDFWTLDGKPQPGTDEIVATLEEVLRSHPNHPGANHYLIHALEASPHPERALASAERLKRLVPGAGHLVHMPSHIYIRIGRYAESSEANRRAIAVDAAAPHDRPIYAMYVAHNFQFLWASALMEGRSAESLRAAREMLKRAPPDMLKTMPGMDSLLAYPVVGLARFGRWKEVLVEPMPGSDVPVPLALWHWARGLALLRMGDSTGATRELAELKLLLQRLAPDTKVALNAAQDVLSIALESLAGELAVVQRDLPTGLQHFERAVAAEDALLYDEPPDWGYPVRHRLGAVLLAAGRPAEAEAVYRADLERHPHNGWALFGLMKCLEAQGKTEQASAARREFVEAWKQADVELSASAF